MLYMSLFRFEQDHFRIEYVAFTLERKLKKRYCPGYTDRAETQDDYRKDNKALRSAIFITKFTKI